MNRVSFLLVFIITFGVYNVSTFFDFKIDQKTNLHRRLLPSADAVPNTFLPYILVQEQSFFFDKVIKTVSYFDDPEHKTSPYFLIHTEKGFISAYPILTGIFAIPVYFIPLTLNKIPEMTYFENINKIMLLGRLAASFYTAFSVAIMYLVFKKISERQFVTISFLIFYALGTNLYTVTSRGLWQHTISVFLYSICIYVIYSKYKNKSILLGALSGLLVLNRLTNIVFPIVFGLYFFRIKELRKFLLGGIPFMFIQAFYNFYFFGNFFSEGYSARNAANVWEGNIIYSLVSYIFSPARGFLFISPIFLLVIPFIYNVFRKNTFIPKYNLILRYSSVFVISSVLLFAKWYTWDGSPAFGSRMLSDYIPFFGLFSFYIFEKIFSNKKNIVILSFIIIYSVYVHSNGVFFRKNRCDSKYNWNFYCLRLPARKQLY